MQNYARPMTNPSVCLDEYSIVLKIMDCMATGTKHCVKVGHSRRPDFYQEDQNSDHMARAVSTHPNQQCLPLHVYPQLCMTKFYPKIISITHCQLSLDFIGMGPNPLPRKWKNTSSTNSLFSFDQKLSKIELFLPWLMVHLLTFIKFNK